MCPSSGLGHDLFIRRMEVTLQCFDLFIDCANNQMVEAHHDPSLDSGSASSCTPLTNGSKRTRTADTHHSC